MAGQPGGEDKAEAILHSAWAEIAAALDRLAAEITSLDQNTIEREALVGFASRRYIAADEIGIDLLADNPFNVVRAISANRVEIFSGRYEFYGFSDSATEIKHIPVTQNSIPNQLKTLLDAVLRSRPMNELISVPFPPRLVRPRPHPLSGLNRPTAPPQRTPAR